jgi:hypothetical protein
MERNTVKLKSLKHITHDVVRIDTEKPEHFTFTPGLASEVSIHNRSNLNYLI